MAERAGSTVVEEAAAMPIYVSKNLDVVADIIEQAAGAK